LVAAILVVSASLAALPVQTAPLELSPIVETKAVYGTVAARNMVPARARTGGTLSSLSVEEGSVVRAGDVLGLVTDDKIALQLDAVDDRGQGGRTRGFRPRLAQDKIAGRQRGDGTVLKTTVDQALIRGLATASP
jgi:multidrug efflux pump subunit AcrA (membrane-fusion protein)